MRDNNEINNNKSKFTLYTLKHITVARIYSIEDDQ